MEAGTIKDIRGELQRMHGELMSGGEVWAEVERALEMLPDGASWMLAPHDPAIVVLSQGALFQIAVRPGNVTMTSRPINADKLQVRYECGPAISSGEPPTATRRTSWTFRYPRELDEDLEEWQRITGTITVTVENADEPDGPERFARELVKRAWLPSPRPA